MARFLGLVLVAALAAALGVPAARTADDKDATATLDKAIKALGGEEKLKSLKAFTWKAKGSLTFGDNESKFTSQATAQGLDHFRSEFQGEFMGNKVKGVTVVAGDKGWRVFGGRTTKLEKGALANEKRGVYLQLVPVTLLPLKGKGFKVEAGPEEKVGGKPAAGLKVTGPDGKTFTLFFDKESGLPVKQVAKVAGFGGMEFTQETTFSDYKEFDGIKKATKVEGRRDGTKFLEQQVTEFKALKKVDPKTFAEPE
jgi:hypothetical protein